MCNERPSAEHGATVPRSGGHDAEHIPMSFTRDFFSEQMPVWQDPDGPLAELHRRAANGEPLALLEVGATKAEARAGCSRISHNPGSQMVSIDHFDSAHTMDGVARFDRFMRNTISVDKCSALEVIPAFSSDAFIRLKHDERCFDLAYIDGSHHRLETTEDAISQWRRLKQNGILIFDDYKWDQHPFDSIEHPHDAIDSFVHLVAPESEVVHRGYQLLRKAAGPRHAVAHPRCELFIIVLAADESYAAPSRWPCTPSYARAWRRRSCSSSSSTKASRRPTLSLR